jgi:DNA-binding response OmpR family regulator
MVRPFLLFDDSYTDVQAFVALVKRIGLLNPVRVIGTAVEAQRYLTACAPARLPVIIFAGTNTRGGTGLELLRWVKEHAAFSDLPLVALLEADEDATSRALALGAGIVEKPLEMRALIAAMKAFALPERVKIDSMTMTVQVELCARGTELPPIE